MALPLPVDPLIDEFNLGPLTCERRGPPTKNEYGEYVPATPGTVTFTSIAAHTANGRDLEMLPASDRNNEVTKFYSRDRFFAADGGQAADVMTYNGRKWRIALVKNYETQGTCYIAWGTLVDRQNE